LLIKQNFVNKIQSSIINKKVFIDDYQRNIYFDCYIIDWTANAEKKYHIDNRKNNYMMLGLDYIVLRPDFYTKQKSLNIESNSCCVILGGTDSANILEFLDLKLFPEFTDIKFNIVNAKNAKLISHNTQKFDWLEPKKLIKIFTSSKFVISAAGQSLYELMVLNKTTFPIIVANNQLDDINNLLEIGFLKSFYDINNKSWINNLIKDITLFNESKLDQNPMVFSFSDGRLNIFNSIIND
jgi:spore coat polysaccharide biosynthesis predicted glycosyltransferase SpsG